MTAPRPPGYVRGEVEAEVVPPDAQRRDAELQTAGDGDEPGVRRVQDDGAGDELRARTVRPRSGTSDLSA